MSNLALHYHSDNSRLYTAVGTKRNGTIILQDCSSGCGLYGPFVNLPRGQYHACVRFAASNRPRGRGWLDVCHDLDAKIIASSAPLDLGALPKRSSEIGITFELYQATSWCQVRLHCVAEVSATIISLEIEFLDADTASIENTVSDGLRDGKVIAPPFVRLRRIRKLKRFMQHPLATARRRLEVAVVDRLAVVVAERAAERMTQNATFRFTRQSGAPSRPYQIWLPAPTVAGLQDGPYMQSANCQARDFYHQDFAAFCQAVELPVALHRKVWEFAFIWHHLQAEGAIRPGARGVGFGVGKEQMPSLLAKHGCEVLATDAPPEITSDGWTDTGQYSSSLADLSYANIVSADVFKKNVRFEFCDMNAINGDIRDFDFCWSACSFEHLGSIESGLDFVVNSVERTLKIGGVACHTSELNLSSNDRTLEIGGTVLFRRRDIERLTARLEDRGHKVKPLPIEPGNSFVDYLVDVPPYGEDMHLRLKIAEFVSTSFGIVVTRCR